MNGNTLKGLIETRAISVEGLGKLLIRAIHLLEAAPQPSGEYLAGQEHLQIEDENWERSRKQLLADVEAVGSAQARAEAASAPENQVPWGPGSR